MASGTGRKITYIIIFFTGLLLNKCANQLPPGGGEVDKIPPEIIFVYPGNGSINYNEGYFEVEFSEYVDKRSVQDAIFISPAIEGNLEYDWSGTSVTVEFPDTLKENTTYVITIGTDVVDYNNKNRMADAFTLVFSTGDKIDNRIVRGKVYDKEPDGKLIFAYKLDSLNINPSEQKPDYISQTGISGEYRLAGLAAGKYRIFAFDDDFRDLLFQPAQDKYGVPYKDILLTDEDTLFTGLNFFLSVADTAKPRIFSAALTDKNHIFITLSEKIDSTYISANNFYLYDSTADKKYKPLYAYRSNSKKNEMFLTIDISFPAENEVFLFADTLKDMNGNIYSNDFASMALTDKPDTTPVFIEKAVPVNNSNKVDFMNSSFLFYLNDAIDSTALKENISFTDTSNYGIDYSIKFIDDASFMIKPEKRLFPQNQYIIKIDFSGIKDAAGNVADTVYTYRFTTITGLDFTGASGRVINIDFSGNPVLVLQSTPDAKYTYTKKLESAEFNFERVEAGEYVLWCYLDEDSSGSYNYGWVYPFVPAERFNFYPDTLNLRPRWSVTDILFSFE